MKKLLILPIVGLLYLAACAGPSGHELGALELEESFGIVGGEDVKASDPMARRVHLMEKITLRDGKKFRGACTASLVHKRLLLTAAHCLPQKEKAEKSAIKIKFILPNKKTVTIEVIDWQSHPQEDLALLELASDAPSSAEILLLPEPQHSYDPQVIEVAGYGGITGNAAVDDESGTLRKAILNVAAYRLDSTRIKVDQSHGKGLCNGDSGAPGLIKDGQFEILIGIAIYTRGSSKVDPCDSEGYLVNLSAYLDWIYQTARDIQVRNSRPSTQLQGN